MLAERTEQLNKIIITHNLSALIFWRPDELVLTLGYLPLWGLSFLVYTADNNPVLFVPVLEPEELWPVNITVKIFPWGKQDCQDPWGILFDEIKILLQQKAVQHKPVSFIREIGGTAPCRMSAEQPPLPSNLLERLSGLTEKGFKDTSKEILNLYEYKTDMDVKGLKLAHRITAVAIKEFYKKTKQGITEAKLAALIEFSVLQLLGQNEVNFVRAWPIIQSGKNTINGGKYNITTCKIIENGDLVLLEMAICVNGYWADITRTIIVGVANQLQENMYGTIIKAQQAAMALLKPGIAMEIIDAASRIVIENAGYGAFFNHALGHQVGFRYHDPGGTLSRGSSSILKEGMVLTIEPGIYDESLDGGLRIEDNVLITKSGYLLLSDYSRRLQE